MNWCFSFPSWEILNSRPMYLYRYETVAAVCADAELSKRYKVYFADWGYRYVDAESSSGSFVIKMAGAVIEEVDRVNCLNWERDKIGNHALQETYEYCG
jgi:hypothetical protein